MEMKSKTMGWISGLGVLLVVVLAGCTNVKGTYACEGGLLDSVRLESGGKAYASMMFLGQRSEKAGTYTVDGDKVNVVLDGQSTVFTYSKNTLDGGMMVGKCTMK
jgi:hypothetical protein